MLKTGISISARRKASFQKQSMEMIARLIERLRNCPSEEIPEIQKALSEEHKALEWLNSLAVKGSWQ